MRHLALAASLLILTACSAFAGDCDGCMAEKMCIRHQKEQDDELKAFVKFRKHKDPMKRKEALDKIGKLNSEHMNHRSKEMAAAIADLLDDTDAGIRMAAVNYMKTNQEVKTAKAELGKMLDRLVPKVSKKKPEGDSVAAGSAGLEWENALVLVKECLTAMAEMGGADVVEYFIRAIKSENLVLAVDAISKSLAIRSKKLVELYLSQFEKMASGKTADEKALCTDLARAFSTHTLFEEQLGENRSAWLRNARDWWQEKEDTYDPPPEPPKDGE